ncbi:Hypothetical predicted protein [Lecanosticta acicola]|uniref:Uncharacterized protein n=1 Tax=Lecanosticta acicola TaxID=111012 RepID=A0AAI8YS27_9PEZI|nr:Hypothetical predicted protein [Lecanosticta acicola]
MESPAAVALEESWPLILLQQNRHNSSSSSTDLLARGRTSSVSSSNTAAANPCAALDEALQKITTAVAHFHRAGPFYQHRSEAFWIFAAGCWGRGKWEAEIRGKLGREGEEKMEVK